MKKTFLDRLFRATEYFMAILLLAMVLFTLANVILRYFFNSSLIWSEELARFCFVWLIYIGIIGALRDNRHLFVDTVLSRLPNKARQIVYFLVQAISLVLFAIFAYGSWGLTALNFENTAEASGIPYAFLYGIGIITGVCGMIICLANIYKLIAKHESVADLLKARDEDVETEMLGGGGEQ
ncbi:MAG: TRAP transporter small permease [Elusimicrobiota bacterium]|jgi:TRAP-type C4-dicarboxylate transport system permease small subunit|nr:TRAP transporter small permease [Elusimicrobiota bacterium]